MTAPGSPLLAPGTVRHLAGLAGKDGDERRLLEGLLELWCRQRGARGAALYLEDEPGCPCEAAWGEGPFPRLRRDVEDGAFEHLEVDGATLLWRRGDGEPSAEELPPPEDEADLLQLLLAVTVANRRLHRRLKRQSFQAKYRGVELEALYDVGLAIASTLDLDALTDEILLRAVSLLDARRGALYLLQEGEYRLQSRFGGAAGESFRPASGEAPGRTDTVPPDLLPGAEHVQAVSIAVDGDPRGLIVAGDKESRTGVGPFTVEDRRTLALLANQAAIALENARLHQEALEKERYERDLQLAAEIQRQILPEGVPDVPGYELAGWNRPAREVGGDYYDLVPLPSEDRGSEDGRVGRLGFALADVSGKGVPAALMVSTLHSAVRLLMGRMGAGPRLVERLNRHILASSAPNKFITLVVGELDASAGRLVYVNAGHNPGLVIRSGGAVERLGAGGLPVGLLPGSTYRDGSLDLAPGDLVCLYSDGITECTSPAGEELGEERLVELLREAADRPVGEVVAVVEEAVTDFARGRPQGDDQTLVLLRRL
ncbi:MAG: PP2C family protein-serine/threonine phosphatase [Thermoanaerobaculia bacterium]